MTIEFDGQNNKLGTTTANSVVIKTNDTDAITIDSSQNVGIGTSSPTFFSGTTGLHLNSSGNDCRIHITNSATGTGSADGAYIFSGSDSAFGLYNGENADIRLFTNATERMRIRGDGNVGIGTTNPTFSGGTGLHLNSSGNDCRIHITNSVVGTGSGDGAYIFSGSDSAFGLLQAENADIRLYTNSLERMRITGSGNVGIGTSSPSSTLSVETSAGTLNVEPLGASAVQLASPTSLGFNIGSGYNYEFDVNGTEAMRIDNNRNVGIGTSSPDGSSFSGSSSPVLDVSGTRPLIILSETDANTKKAWLGLSSDQFFVGGTNTDTVFYTNNAEAMRINSTGDMMIGTTSTNSNERLRIKNGDDTRAIAFQSATSAEAGYIYINSGGTSVSYSTSSDYRLKENVVDLTSATDRLKQLQPKRFNFIADADTTVDGFLAHEVSSIVPEAITGTKDEVDADGNPIYQGIDQSKLVPLLTASLQEALTEIDNLKARIEALENV